jgi:hypothetical protein
MVLSRFLPLFAGVLLLSACSNDPLDVDTSGVDVQIRYTNLDSLMQHTNEELLLGKLLEQRVRTQDVIDYELGYCLGVGSVMDTALVQNLAAFRNNPYVKRLEERISQKFPDLAQRHAKITEGFRHIKAHLPDASIPTEIVYMNSYFQSSAFCTDKEIAVGLERYLGAKTDVIKELPPQDFFPWIKEKMDPQYLERDAVTAWIMTNIVKDSEEDATTHNIEQIIRWGKILYLTEAAFPDQPKHWIMRYSEKDYKWAIENERSFWEFLVAEKMLFTTDEQLQANVLNDGPFTAGLPEKAPDRLGQFLGWRIIQSYMEQYDVTLQELMALPYTELLQEYEITE